MTHYSKKTKSGSRNWIPATMALVLAFGVLIGIQFGKDRASITVINQESSEQGLIVGKVDELIRYIDAKYVEDLERDTLINGAINRVLSSLDPHSSYIDSRRLYQIENRLNGSYVGIGVEFVLRNDSILVLDLPGDGPALDAGLEIGDRILSLDGNMVSGAGLSMDEIEDLFKGEANTKLSITALSSAGQAKEISLKRASIAIPSVDQGIMVDPTTGYIKINRFAQKTYFEFMEQLDSMSQLGLRHLIIDLRDNSGGYLTQATKILDQLFKREGELLVYTEGRRTSRNEYKTTGRNLFDVDQVAILINEGSASASEIIAGAIQDNDRGIILGQRSFGKGLVQEQYLLSDGSALRLTVAKYYTPSGRSIQRPYSDLEDYNDGPNRGADSLDLKIENDSFKYYTKNGREVYSEGGIMPDVLIEESSEMNYPLVSRTSFNLFYALNKTLVDGQRELIEGAADQELTVPESIVSAYQFFSAKEEGDSASIAPLAETDKMELYYFMVGRLQGESLSNSLRTEQDEMVAKAVELFANEEDMDKLLGY